MKIGIAGCGGIGSNIAVHLVRSGILELKVVDFDKVEESNLNRQFYFKDQTGKIKVSELKKNLLRINPDASIETENKKLTAFNLLETFKDCPIVVEGFDRKNDKLAFVEVFSQTDKFAVCASGVAGLDIDKIEIKKIGDNINIVGDFKSDIKDKKLFSAKVFVVASIMANLILIKLGFKDNK
jgi:sulfur carrier protein ThiS adenylyltransferase